MPAALSRVEMKLLRFVLVYLMLRRFEFGKANLRPLLGYPTGGALVTMLFQGERLLDLTWHKRNDRKIVVKAARAIVASAECRPVGVLSDPYAEPDHRR